MARFGWDLDGVVYDFTHSVRHYLVEYKGFDPDQLIDPTQWDFFENDWGIPTREFMELWREGVDEGIIFLHGTYLDNALEVFKQAKADGHTNHIVTHRTVGKKSITNTEGWLVREGFEFDSLSFSADKTIIDVDAFIEDKVENFQDLEAAGVDAYLLDRPWNRHFKTTKRVHSLESYYQRACETLWMKEIRELLPA